MTPNDIRPLDSLGDGKEGYFVQRHYGMVGGGCLRYVVIDAAGHVEDTPVSKAWDPAAMTEEEAVIHHLTKTGALARAEADLERRRRAAPEAPPEPPPLDPATERFSATDNPPHPKD